MHVLKDIFSMFDFRFRKHCKDSKNSEKALLVTTERDKRPFLFKYNEVMFALSHISPDIIVSRNVSLSSIKIF